MLEVSSFSKSYNGHPVLNIPHLVIKSGVSWFQGVNGSGKSTFLKALCGIVPFEGKIGFQNGPDLKKSPVEYRKLINYAFAEPRFPEFVSGKEILEYYRSTYSWSKENLEELVLLFGIHSFYGSAISTYSSGMLKKISLISAFIGSPSVLALDEPFTTIDTQTQELLLKLLNESINRGQSVLIASHHDWPQNLLNLDHHFKVENQTIHASA